jgi:putative drug exporter of the RND superfamily
MTFWHRLAGAPTGRVGRWLVVAVWVGVAAWAGPLAGGINDVSENDASAWVPRTAESTRAAELAARFGDTRELSLVVVYERAGGLTGADRVKAAADRPALQRLGSGGQLSPPITSEDGAALLVAVPLDGADEDAAYDATVSARELAGRDVPAGLQVKVTGPAGFMVDSADAFLGADVTTLAVTVAVVAVILLLTYRSPVLWLLPLVTVALANSVVSAVVYLLARDGRVTVNGMSAGILTVLVFGVGTDYALLLVARYREELHRYTDRREAMRVALWRAFPALLASAATVTIGLLCLLAADMNNIRSLGPIGAIGVAGAFAAMTTLLPALLVICGRWLFWPRVPTPDMPVPDRPGVWARVGAAIAPRPRAVWVGTVIVLAALAAGLTGLRTGIPGEEAFTTTPESIEGQRLLAQHFPAGAAAPAEVIANEAAEPAVRATLEATPGVATVLDAERAGGLVRVHAVLTDPADSPAAERTVERIRAAVHRLPGADAVVGGVTATGLDTAAATRHDRALVIPLVLAVVMVILALLLRSLVAPLLLLATVVLSFLAALGVTWLASDRLLGFPAVDHQLVLTGFVFLVALGIDYNIFLVTRIREAIQEGGASAPGADADTGAGSGLGITPGPHAAPGTRAPGLGIPGSRAGAHHAGVLRGLSLTGGVITSAGLVLAATFSVLTVLPLVLMVELAILVAFGVLLDTFVVRSLLVPAIALDTGPRFWWPSRLAVSAGGSGGDARRLPVADSGSDTTGSAARLP